MNRAFRAIRRADVVALVIEAMACITEQVYCPPDLAYYMHVLVIHSTFNLLSSRLQLSRISRLPRESKQKARVA